MLTTWRLWGSWPINISIRSGLTQKWSMIRFTCLKIKEISLKNGSKRNLEAPLTKNKKFNNLKSPNKLQCQYPKWRQSNQLCPRCLRWVTWLVSMRKLTPSTISKRPSLKPQISTLYWIYTTNSPVCNSSILNNLLKVASNQICRHLAFNNNNNLSSNSSRLNSQWCKWINSCSKSNPNFSSSPRWIKLQINSTLWCRCSRCSNSNLSPNFSIKIRVIHLGLFNRRNLLKLAHLVISKVRHLFPNKSRISTMGALSTSPLITSRQRPNKVLLPASPSSHRWTKDNPSKRPSSTLL